MHRIPVARGVAPLFILIALTGCQTPTQVATPALLSPGRPDATPSPAASRTPLPRPTITAWRSATPTLDPTPRWGAPPPEPVGAYALATWDAATTLDWAQTDLGPFPVGSDGYGYDAWSAGGLVAATLFREVAARYPDSPEAVIARRTLLNPVTLEGSGPVSVEPFRAAFEQRLNAEPNLPLSAEALTALANDLLGLDAIVVREILVGENLLGDGASGRILNLQANDRDAALFALVGGDGDYRLFALRSTWFAYFQNDYEVTVRDLNANGQPEILIQDNYRGTGFAHTCDKILTALEWVDGGFTNRTPNVATSAQTDYSECLSFEIEPRAGAPATISTGYTLDTGCFINDTWFSRSSTLARRYAWNGSFFVLTEEVLAPPEQVDLAGAPVDACTLRWANLLGAEHAVARAALAGALASDDPELVAAYRRQYGPAYHDLFAFKLGVAQATNSDADAARGTLTAVRDAPRAPRYTAASQLAAVFLAAYETQGVVAGCRAVAGMLDLGVFRAGPDAYMIAYDTDAMREAWGFADDFWGQGGRRRFDSPWLQTDPLNVCNPVAAFRQEVGRRAFPTIGELSRFLEAHGIPYAGLQEADVDNNGRRDWVGLFGTGWDGRLDLWVLLNGASGIDAQWVSATASEAGSVPSAVAAFTPDSSVSPLTVYQWTGGAAVLQAVPLTTGHRVVNRLEALHFVGPGTQQQSFSIMPNAGLDGASTLTVRQNPTSDWIALWVTVGWDARSQTLVEIDRAGTAEYARLIEVERLLFGAHEPDAASAAIGSLIANWRDLPRMLRYGVYGPDTFRPYLRYLQGLAAEETGDEAAAVAAYWTLWNDYPLHPLAYIAALRLELRDP